MTLFYGTEGVDFATTQASYLGHYGEADDWEPLDEVRQLEADVRAAGRDVDFHYYSGAEYWFFEADRPEYDPEAADLAWRRTTEFLGSHLTPA